ncbi:MAG TPA: hypothetical protein VL400_02950, partial [Polyangiaceae bacterium]|nr:hypothetical protein [Polyangiaceae bacterium]
SGSGGSGSATGTSSGGASGTGGGGPSVPTCHPTCAAPVDCAQPSPAFDQDNWDCVDTECVYLGCLDTTECQATFQNNSYVCGTVAGSTVPTCHIGCSGAIECAQPSPAFDEDNWSCVDGGCVYLGCNSAQECQDSLMNPNYDCVTVAGSSVATCQPTCTGAADCAQPSAAYDNDNWDCVEGRCEYLGCQSTDECQQSFMSASYVCE